MPELEPIPSKISDMFPKEYVPKIIRLRNFVGKESRKRGIDPLTSGALGKFANMQYRIANITSDYSKDRESCMRYNVGEEPIRHAEGQVNVHPEDKDRKIEILQRQASGVFDTYFKTNSGAILLTREIDAYIDILFKECL